jgi:hypothetical protein
VSSSSTSGLRAEVLNILREWLTEANDVAYHEGGTYASVLAKALERLQEKEGDEESDSGPGSDLRAGDLHDMRG